MKSHFIPGLLIGGVLGAALASLALFSGPIAIRDQVFDETSEDLIKTARQLDNCSAAYVVSHGGRLPKGTLVQGEGRALVVVGFDALRD